jgi:hypothetical protein
VSPCTTPRCFLADGHPGGHALRAKRPFNSFEDVMDQVRERAAQLNRANWAPASRCFGTKER